MGYWVYRFSSRVRRFSNDFHEWFSRVTKSRVKIIAKSHHDQATPKLILLSNLVVLACTGDEFLRGQSQDWRSRIHEHIDAGNNNTQMPKLFSYKNLCFSFAQIISSDSVFTKIPKPPVKHFSTLHNACPRHEVTYLRPPVCPHPEMMHSVPTLAISVAIQIGRT